MLLFTSRDFPFNLLCIEYSVYILSRIYIALLYKHGLGSVLGKTFY